MYVQMNWQKREKNGRGFLAAEIFDATNRLISDVPPKKFSLSEETPSLL